IQRISGSNILRYHFRCQFFEGVEAQKTQHLTGLKVGWADVSTDKFLVCTVEVPKAPTWFNGREWLAFVHLKPLYFR
ncbi:MAG: hypothetical protein C5B49_08010, partial [Bdellovibrio sp.]